MILVTRFFDKWKRDGFWNAIKLIPSFIGNPVDSLALKNAIRFRDRRIYTSCEISQLLPRSTNLPHPVGIVVGAHVEVGENVEIRQNVTIGERMGDNPSGQPIIEDGANIYTGAVVLGNITLGEGCAVGANSVVLDDVEEGETVVGAPAKVVK